MAYTTHAAPVRSGHFAGFAAPLARVKSYVLYRKTYNALAALSARELDDLGLNRSMLKRVAWQAAHEAQ